MSTLKGLLVGMAIGITSVLGIMILMITLYVAFGEPVPATEEECASSEALAQAVLDRDLKWGQVLVCKDNGLGIEYPNN